MKKYLLLVMVATIIIFEGCATVLSGYYDNVEITGIDEQAKIITADGVNLPIYKKKVTERIKVEGDYDVVDNEWYPNKRKIERTIYYIKLRANKNYVLSLRYLERTKRIDLFPKLNGWWFFFDIFPGAILGGIPFFIDYYTGNWNTFDDIEMGF